MLNVPQLLLIAVMKAVGGNNWMRRAPRLIQTGTAKSAVEPFLVASPSSSPAKLLNNLIIAEFRPLQVWM